MRKTNIALAALFLAVVLSIALNAITLSTISQQQSTIRGLRAQVEGLLAVQEVATRTDREMVNVVGELDWQVSSIQATQDIHSQILDGLVQNDADIAEILSRLVSLVE